jgi:WD40 repeat protein
MVAGKLDLVPKIMGRDEKSLEKFVVSPDGQTIAFLGNDGYIILIDVKSRQWIADLKMNGSVRAVTFTPDGEQILASGSDGDVYRYVSFRIYILRFVTIVTIVSPVYLTPSRPLPLTYILDLI